MRARLQASKATWWRSTSSSTSLTWSSRPTWATIGSTITALPPRNAPTSWPPPSEAASPPPPTTLSSQGGRQDGRSGFEVGDSLAGGDVERDGGVVVGDQPG